MNRSSFIDFSEKISDDVLSCIHLNKKFQNYQFIAEKMGYSSSMLAVPEQIHSSDVIFIDKPGYYENIDGGHSAAANQQERAKRSALEFTYLTQKLFPQTSME